MLGSQIIPTTPFNIGQIPSIGMGYNPFTNPMVTPGLWTGMQGVPQAFGMPGIGGINNIGQIPAVGLGIGSIGQIPGATPYGLFGGLGGQIGNQIGNLFGGFNQAMPGFNPFGGLFGGFNLPSFTVHSIAIMTPTSTFDPLAQLVKFASWAGLASPGLQSPYDQFGPFNPLQQVIQKVGQLSPLGQILSPFQHSPFSQLSPIGQSPVINPFQPGAFVQQNPLTQQSPFIQQNPFVQQLIQQSPLGIGSSLGGRQVVRAYVQTMMGLIPIDLVV